MIFQNGSVIRLQNGATSIAMLIEERTIVCTHGVLRAVQASEILENPAVCPSCRSSRWYWEENLAPKCRACDPPSPEWEGALLGRALAALYVWRHDETFVGDARTVLQRAFETWDLDRLLLCAGAQALHEHLTNRKRKDRS